jgi:uncharacterized membrane protein
MLVSSISVCFGQLFWKLSVDHGLLFLLLGFALYGIGSIVMLIAFKFGDLSTLHPVLSFNYVLTVILAVAVLNESMSFFKIGGIISIIIGVIFIGSSGE